MNCKPASESKIPKSLQRPDGRCVRLRHGETNNGAPTRLYTAWVNMRNRCFNPKCSQYPNYGARGITVCDSWLEFENFRDDMGPKPEGASLDRINNNGNYEPGNCRWATVTEQARNQRKTRLVPYQGALVSLAEASERSGIPYNRLKARANRGASEEAVLYSPERLPSRRGNPKLTREQVTRIRSDSRGVAEISIEYGVTKSCIYAIKKGDTWSE